MPTRHVRVWKGEWEWGARIGHSHEFECCWVRPIPCLAVAREEVWGCGEWVGGEGWMVDGKGTRRDGRGEVDGDSAFTGGMRQS